MKTFLENSNQNGFGFLVISVLLYLFIFFLIQYFHHKKHFYLLYGLYAMVNAVNLFKGIDGVFFSDFFDSQAGFKVIRIIHYPSQLLGTLFFTYFIIEIMRLKQNHPKSIQVITYAYVIISPVYLGLYGFQMINIKSYLIDYFHLFVFLPFCLIMFFYVFYLVYKQRLIIKSYILSGMAILVSTYFVIAFFSIKDYSVNDKTLYIFYIGILMESLFFALAIGLEHKVLYQEKVAVQKKYISQLEQNQIMKQSINRMLEEELNQTKSNVIEMTEELQRQRIEKLTIKFENKFSQLRLDAVRSQMNPHFIFNALNSIKSYFIENNKEKAIFYLTKFSKLIRKILESSRVEQIALSEELETLRLYVEIENDRFKNNINFSINVDEGIAPLEIMVPSLFLQPFVENAIWHGLATKKGEKKLEIRVAKSKKPNTLKIEVEDNGVGRHIGAKRSAKNPFKKESLGLRLSSDRFDLFSKKFNKAYHYTIQDVLDEVTKKNTGTLVVIEIPR